MRFRFSLRHFLILFTLIAIALGGLWQFAFRVKNQIARHNAAVAKLRERQHDILWSGANQNYIADRSLVAQLSRRWIDPAAFVGLKGCRITAPHHLGPLTPSYAKDSLKISRDLFAMRDLRLQCPRLDAETIDLLKQQPALKKLFIDCRVVDASANAHLADLTAIDDLLIAQPISDETAAALAKLPNLTTLHFNPSKLSARGAAELEKFPKLAVLILSGPAPAPGVMQSLAKIQSLTTIHVHCDEVSDASLAELAGAPFVSKISLAACRFPESLFLRLSKVPSLSELEIELLPQTPIHRLSDLDTAPQLATLEFSTRDMEGFEIPAFNAPASLKRLKIYGSISNSAVKSILASAPICEIEVKNDLNKFRFSSGKRYRLQDGQFQYYDFEGVDDFNLMRGPPFAGPNWMPLAD
jgi:hypothetical protein